MLSLRISNTLLSNVKLNYINRFYSVSTNSTAPATTPVTNEKPKISKSIRKQQIYEQIKENYSLAPMEFNQEYMNIDKYLRSIKTKVIAMPFDYSYTSFYKNKRSNRKKFTYKKKHLHDFGANPSIFPESMFRTHYMQPIPLAKVQEGNMDN
ncbi:hypothetical protein DLAC_05947 [Tieghemostelium lacteum]|uniref:Uncharacterized protein n=1 Tax=Tieghemostelium lacteum TaxID=361077 RepID=A0A151ZH99_TIELA|nr:hypothetical protein DLAC_05947 [Tieghemostelium lacteum]|eukprot:KYQ93285.1 hypothetical protein DLAC_05947 [Tieghemostelium lacteum]